MRSGARWARLVVAILTACIITGCLQSGSRRDNPPDPLLMSKTPAKSKFTDVSEKIPQPESSTPLRPAGVWMVSPVRAGNSVRLGPPQDPPAVPEVPARLSFAESVAGYPSSAELPMYGQATDSRWLQGVLEQVSSQGCLLRYTSLAGPGSTGRAMLQDHPRLELLEKGDVVRVEGRFVKDADSGRFYPAYHVDHVQRVRTIH